MIAVIFEVHLADDAMKSRYLEIAAGLRDHLDSIEGFLSIERFTSVSTPGKMLSLSFWKDEQAVQQWRSLETHRQAQHAGRVEVFQDYRLRVAAVIRDYGMEERDEAPVDSRAWHESQAEAPVPHS